MAIDSSPGSSRSGTPLGGWPAALLALLQRRALHLLPPPAPPLHRAFRPLDEPPLGSLAPHRCPACLAAFPSPWLLERHAALQHPPGPEDKPFVCEQCGQSYRYRSAYAKHREQNHRARLPADKLFTCDVCGMQFRYLKSFKKHRLNHALERLHGARDRADRVSSTDDALVPRSGELDLSIRGPSSITDPEDSDAEFRRARSEDAEDETVDESATPEAEKSPEERTETSFANVSSLADSSVGEPSSSGGMRVEVAPDAALLGYLNPERQRERRFACPFCGKCVRSKENLKLHVRKHTGERPFVCLFCGRAFGGKSDLTRHLRIHTGERPYHCEACGKCFARADYLSKHLTTHIHNPR